MCQMSILKACPLNLGRYRIWLFFIKKCRKWSPNNHLKWPGVWRNAKPKCRSFAICCIWTWTSRSRLKSDVVIWLCLCSATIIQFVLQVNQILFRCTLHHFQFLLVVYTYLYYSSCTNFFYAILFFMGLFAWQRCICNTEEDDGGGGDPNDPNNKIMCKKGGGKCKQLRKCFGAADSADCPGRNSVILNF